MLTEVSPEEALHLLLLGDIDFGLVVETINLGNIFENLKIVNNKCKYIEQGNSVFKEWTSTPAQISAKQVFECNLNMCPSNWKKILKIYIIDKE
jgi:hypothetical protein